MQMLLQLDNYKPIMDIYQNYFRTGAAYYNASNFEDAYNNFKKCLAVSEYLTEKNISNVKLDTSVILYTGISAEKVNKTHTLRKKRYCYEKDKYICACRNSSVAFD